MIQCCSANTINSTSLWIGKGRHYGSHREFDQQSNIYNNLYITQNWKWKLNSVCCATAFRLEFEYVHAYNIVYAHVQISRNSHRWLSLSAATNANKQQISAYTTHANTHRAKWAVCCLSICCLCKRQTANGKPRQTTGVCACRQHRWPAARIPNRFSITVSCVGARAAATAATRFHMLGLLAAVHTFAEWL